MDKILVTEDLGDLQNELHGISSKWYNNVEKEVSTQVECLREMLKTWLKQVDPYPTRNVLINALKCPVINEQRLAQQLLMKYTTDGVTPSASDIQSVSGSNASNATTPVPALPLMPQTSVSQTPGLQLQRQPGSQQTGTKHISIGGAKYISAGGADQVSTVTKIPTVTPTAAKRGSSDSGVPKAKRTKTAADVVGGYPYEFVSQPPDELLCQMCNYVAKEPQQLKCCGALYCKSCLDRITSNAASHVPHCCVKCKSSSLDHFFDRKSNEQIQKLSVQCTNSDHGCDWTGELKDLDDHRSQCPKEEIPCTFSEVGCETRLLRENLDDHITQDQQQHLHCAVTSISRLKQELATTRGELQEVQGTLSKSMQTLPMILKMSNYAQFKTTEKTWCSTPFYSHRSECRQHLCVQHLQTSKYSKKIGVALELESSPPRDRSICLTVELLNQARDATHLRFNPKSTFGASKSCEEILVLSECPDVQYLCEDCLYFRISENEGDVHVKPWLVDLMPRRSDLVLSYKAVCTSD